MLNFLVKTPHMTLPQSHNQLVTVMSHRGTQIFAIVNVGLQVCKLFFIPIFSLICHKYMWLNSKIWIQLWCRDGFDNHNWVTSKIPSTFYIFLLNSFVFFIYWFYYHLFSINNTKSLWSTFNLNDNNNHYNFYYYNIYNYNHFNNYN